MKHSLAIALLAMGWFTSRIAADPEGVAKRALSPKDAPTLTLPATLTVPPGVWIIVKPTAWSGEAIQWVCPDVGMSQLPSDLLVKPDVFVAMAPAGTYRVMAVAAGSVDGKAQLSPFAVCVVTIGTPVPPGPTPPGPTPPTPVPNDPFFTLLNASYAQDTDPNKAANAKLLAAFFRQGGSLDGSDPNLITIGNKSFATINDFFSRWDAVVVSKLGPGPSKGGTVLTGVRKAIAAELNSVLPMVPTATLDDATRALISKHYMRMAVDLDALNPTRR